MNAAWELFTELRGQCSELKQQGKWTEQIPLQKKVIGLSEPFGSRHVSNAWAGLAYLYHQTRQYALAEEASRTALAHHDESLKNAKEHLATLQFQLATILADQDRFHEAAEVGEAAIKNFTVLHDPQSAFLNGRIADLEEMRKFRDNPIPNRDNMTADSRAFRPESP